MQLRVALSSIALTAIMQYPPPCISPQTHTQLGWGGVGLINVSKFVGREELIHAILRHGNINTLKITWKWNICQTNYYKTIWLTRHCPWIQTSLWCGNCVHRSPSVAFPKGVFLVPTLHRTSQGLPSNIFAQKYCSPHSLFEKCPLHPLYRNA